MHTNVRYSHHWVVVKDQKVCRNYLSIYGIFNLNVPAFYLTQLHFTRSQFPVLLVMNGFLWGKIQVSYFIYS